jgi:phage terminase small subunit
MSDKSTDAEIRLTPKQQIFISEYCNNGFNGTQAAIKAGYSKNTAKQIAAENLSKLYFKEAIKKYLDEVLSQYKNTLEYEIIQTYKILAFYNPDDIITKQGKLKKDLSELGDLAKVVTGIEVSYSATGKKKIKIKLADRENALKQLANYMNLIKDGDTNNVNIITIDQLKAIKGAWVDNPKRETKNSNEGPDRA